MVGKINFNVGFKRSTFDSMNTAYYTEKQDDAFVTRT